MEITVKAREIIAGDVLLPVHGYEARRVALGTGPSWLDGCTDVKLLEVWFPVAYEVDEPVKVDRPVTAQERQEVRAVVRGAFARLGDPWQGQAQCLSDQARSLLDLMWIMATGYGYTDHESGAKQVLQEQHALWEERQERREASDSGMTLEQYRIATAPLPGVDPFSDIYDAWWTCAQVFVDFLGTATRELYPDEASFRRAAMNRAETEAEWAVSDIQREKRWRLSAVLAKRAARLL